MATPASRPELLVIVGETGSGKSDLAMKVAKKFNGEIICADSWTVYKGFNIGTSKPSRQQQTVVRHHLLDVVEADDGFNAPKFKKLAEKAIADIQQRGKLPIMAGGTGLYLDSVLFDFGFLDNSEPAVRLALNAMGIDALLAQAKKQNIDLTAIDIRNKRRVVRAIESGGKQPTKKAIRPDVLIVGLQVPREELRQRIEDRTDKMIAAGLESEVKDLASKYGWDSEPLKGIGYREWQAFFAGKQSLEETRNRIISSTMNLAKRQRTWFKRNRYINWFSDQNQAYKFVQKSLLNT